VTAGGGWDNEAVWLAAPHANAVNRLSSPENILSSTDEGGDLWSLRGIRASAIDDKAMMKMVSVQQLVDFFLYVRDPQPCCQCALGEDWSVCGVARQRH
jgi:hypothetical protein